VVAETGEVSQVEAAATEEPVEGPPAEG
jgi:hypothetical protein